MGFHRLTLALCLFAVLPMLTRAADPATASPSESSLREALFTRTALDGRKFGSADLDILFWDSTEHLLSEPSHAQALAALDEFIEKDGASSVREPVRRAWLQRDLWRLFDWTYEARHRVAQAQLDELRSRLATLIRRLALSPQQIASLPDNLASLNSLDGGAEFPSQFGGPWVVVALEGTGAVAPGHMISFDGHSTFNVLVRLPGGRPATQAWIKELQQELSQGGAEDFLARYPKFNFPANTRWALVRTLNVIDDQGTLRATRCVESVQMRIYQDPARPMRPRAAGDSTPAPQTFAKAHADRANLPALHVVGPAERAFNFIQFAPTGIDPFEMTLRNTVIGDANPALAQGVVLRECAQCHHSAGVTSVRSVVSLAQAAGSSPRPVHLVEGSFDREAALTLEWKRQQPNWKELRASWEAAGAGADL